MEWWSDNQQGRPDKHAVPATLLREGTKSNRSGCFSDAGHSENVRKLFSRFPNSPTHTAKRKAVFWVMRLNLVKVFSVVCAFIDDIWRKFYHIVLFISMCIGKFDKKIGGRIPNANDSPNTTNEQKKSATCSVDTTVTDSGLDGGQEN